MVKNRLNTTHVAGVLVGIFLLMVSTGASAQNMVSPAVSSWLNMNQATCLQRGAAGLRNAGITNIAQNQWFMYGYANNLIVVIKCVADDGTNKLINPRANRILLNLAVSGPSSNGAYLTQLRDCLRDYIYGTKSCWEGTNQGNQSGARLATSKQVFAAKEPIVVYYYDMPAVKGNLEWITVVPVGTAANTWKQWFEAPNKNGKLTFTGLPPGNYEVRGYFTNGDRTIRAMNSFTVR